MEEFRKGQLAMEAVITGQGETDAPAAFYRDGIGLISIYWGTEGKIPNKSFAESSERERLQAFAGGSGIAKIIAKRNREGNDGFAIARAMIPTIAFGEVGPIYGPDGGQRRDICRNSIQARLSLFRFQHAEIWILTGFDEHDGP